MWHLGVPVLYHLMTSTEMRDTFKPDPKSSSFQRPKTEMNVASGCPRFVPLDDLHRNVRHIQARSQAFLWRSSSGTKQGHPDTTFISVFGLWNELLLGSGLNASCISVEVIKWHKTGTPRCHIHFCFRSLE